MERIAIISCGGTFDKSKFTRSGKFVCGDPAAAGFLNEVGANESIFRVESLMRKDSLDMDDADRALVLEAVLAAAEERIVIVHGTDTMTDTAEFLDGKIGAKTAVLVGAMRPAVFTGSDAAFNLGYAVACAQQLPTGVWLAMHGSVWRAGEVKKDTERYRFMDA